MKTSHSGKSIITAMLLLTASVTAAHVVVKPNQAGVGSYQTFTVGVPVEKNMPTIGLRLVIPEGLEHVTPNVKPGWVIDVQKAGSDEAARVTQITWKGGKIPAGQRDDFSFSAKVPTGETTIQWKAYQTYSDGSVVAWDGSATSTPFSETKVVNDVVKATTTSASKSVNSLPITISLVALVFSIIALGKSRKQNP
jgi:uncharacterized protein YcnI